MNKFKIGDRVRANFRGRERCFIEIIINELNIQRAALCYGGMVVRNVWQGEDAHERIGERAYEPVEGALHRDWETRLQLVTLDNPAQCRRCLGPAPAAERCTNGHCYPCHRDWCTDGGATSPGHLVRRREGCVDLFDQRTWTSEPFRLRDGWYCLVNGVQHGPWPDKGTAAAGYQVEQRRAEQPS